MTDFDKDSERDSMHRDLHDQIHNQVRDQIRDRVRSRVGRGMGGPAGAYHGIFWGGAICVVGIILLLDHMGLVSAGDLWRFWPMLVVVAGAINLTQPGKRPWGAFLMVAGLLFQLDSLGLIHFRWAELWPMAIIASGLMMIWGSIEARRRRINVPESPSSMNATAVFGGVERRITARDFRFGRVSAVFGGVELDFHGADIEGDEAVMEVNAIFGGVEIRVPDHWNVEARNQTLFGGYSDTTRAAANPSAGGTTPGKKLLVITGQVLFGGIEVKN
jgi:predicted membrane protein